VGEQKSAADSASLADFGNEDVEKVEAEIESGAPLEIPEVPEIPGLPQEVSDGKLGADVSATQADAAEIPKQNAATGGAAAGKAAAGGTSPADSGA
jgi:hypothetical protein